MDQLFAWWNLIFYIPLMFGVLLVIGNALGLAGDGDADHDVDADHDLELDHDVDIDHDIDADCDADTDHDHDAGDGESDHDHGHSLVSSILSVYGIGRVPLTIVLMCASLIFGGAGVISNAILGTFIGSASLIGIISAVIAYVVMTILTGLTTRALAAVMPSTETYNITRNDLIGQFGTLILSANGSKGLVDIRDHEGNLHRHNCRTAGEEIAKLKRVIVIDFDRNSNTYVVSDDPTEELMTEEVQNQEPSA